MKSSSNSNRFYDQLAPVYHIKVDWKNRAGKENRLFEFLTKTLQPSRVLDIGCGDGGHAQRYADAGVKYHGIDKSSTMVQAAKSACGQMPGVSFSTGDMTKLPKSYSKQFDQIIVLGNTIPHLITSDDMKKAVAGFSRCLGTGGHLVLQTVNPRVLENKSVFLLPPKLAQGTLFTPFYVNRGKYWEFVMPIFSVANESVSSKSAATTMLRFWSREELKAAGATCGLRLVSAFGDAGLSPYKPRSSGNMILLFRKIADA